MAGVRGLWDVEEWLRDALANQLANNDKKTMKRIGRVKGENLEDLKKWCSDRRHLLKPSTSTYAPGREELWLRRGCDLKTNPTIFEGYREERIEKLGDRLLPGWHIGLVLLYRPGISIKLHRDHTVFEAIAVTVNLGEATFFYQSDLKLPLETHRLVDGGCYRFNTKMPHGVEPVSSERWCIGFWHLKPEYLQQKLELFSVAS